MNNNIRGGHHKNSKNYGKYWNSINFELAKGTKAIEGSRDTVPTMGTLTLGNYNIELTTSEVSRLIDELSQAKHQLFPYHQVVVEKDRIITLLNYHSTHIVLV